MIVSKRTHDALIVKYTALQAKYNTLVEQQKHVTQERNKAGTLLLDCLRLLDDIPISTRQKGGAALSTRKEDIFRRAQEKGWWPVKEETRKEDAMDPDGE